MYKENKLGIKVYDENIYIIDNIHFSVNSISISGDLDKFKRYFRFINTKIYGFNIYKTKK
jgi:hypothetical protein